MSENGQLQRAQLRRFEPLGELSDARLDELATLAYCEHFAMGTTLFREGDIENHTMYLLAGDVQLSSSDGRVERVIRHEDEEARHPLDDSQPRQSTCVSLTPVEVLRIDNSVLDYMMMWDQVGISAELETRESEAVADEAAPDESGAESESAAAAAEAEAPAAGDDASAENTGMPEGAGDDWGWIRKMRHIMAFKSLPPANIRRLLEKMEAVEVGAGESIVRQGDDGDYYYVLVDGRARVTRTIELATLEPGRSFGEEALLSGSRRNASVSMLEDGVVMRLAKRDFDEMLREPMLNRLIPADAREQIAAGARWLDVRHAREFGHGHLPDAVNIPLHELRMRIDELDRDTAYICYCRTGHRSTAAAFLLAQQGFQASVLNGGVQVMARELVTGG